MEIVLSHLDDDSAALVFLVPIAYGCFIEGWGRLSDSSVLKSDGKELLLAALAEGDRLVYDGFETVVIQKALDALQE